jgi:alkyl hydroperoxide reductase subunit AhpC
MDPEVDYLRKHHLPHLIDRMLRELLSTRSDTPLTSAVAFMRRELFNLSSHTPSLARSIGPNVTNRSPVWVCDAVADQCIASTPISLEDYKGSWVLLFFYPSDFDPSCVLALADLSDGLETLNSVGCSVAAISTNSANSHLAWVSLPQADGGVPFVRFPLLSDGSHRVCQMYGVLNSRGCANFAAIVLDRGQVIRYRAISASHVGLSVGEIVWVVRLLQHADDSGTSS